MADDWIGITAGQRINFEERPADLDQLIETQAQAIALTLSVASKRVAARKLRREEAEKELEKAVAPLQTELDSLCESREEVVSWQAESAAAGERAAQLVELAEMAHLRLNNLPPDRQSEFMDMLDVVVTVVGDAPQGRTGQPCALAAWFRERGRTVPILTDETWEKIASLLTYKSRGVDLRLVMRGILYKVWTDTPWRTFRRCSADTPRSRPTGPAGVSPASGSRRWMRWRVRKVRNCPVRALRSFRCSA
nr:hypothetical protein OG781_35750 [Streptomyces sp. NBC_00830]